MFDKIIQTGRLILFYRRIIESVVQTSGFVALFGLAHNQIADVDDVAEFANLTRGFRAFEQTLCLLIKDVKTVPCTVKAQVAANDADIGTHNLIYLFDALSDEYHLLGVASAFVVPVGNV
jgi:hypothetical protein